MNTTTTTFTQAANAANQSVSQTTQISKKQLQKKLVQMILFLTEVLNKINGNSTEQIELSVLRCEKYTGLIKLLQQDLESQIEKIKNINNEITNIEKDQKILSWVALGLGIACFLIGGATAWTGGGLGLLAVGVSFIATASLELSGAIETMNESIDEANKGSDGILSDEEKQKAAGQKIAAKVGIILALTLLTAGIAAAGSTAAAGSSAAAGTTGGTTSAASAGMTSTVAQTGAHTSRTAGQIATQFGKELVKEIPKELFFNSFYGFSTFGMVEDCAIAANDTNLSNEDKLTINIVLTAISMLAAIAMVSKGKFSDLKNAFTKAKWRIKNLTRSKADKQARNLAASKFQKAFRNYKATKADRDLLALLKRNKNTRPTPPPRPTGERLQNLKAFIDKRRALKPTANAVKATANTTKSTANAVKATFKRINNMIDSLISKTISKKNRNMIKIILKIILTNIATIPSAINAKLNINKGDLQKKLGGFLKTASYIKASEGLVDEFLQQNRNFIELVKEFMENVQSVIKTSATNPQDYLADETEFARIFGQAV